MASLGWKELTANVRYRATSRKVAGSVPDGVIGNPSGRSVAPPVDSAPKRNDYQEYFLCC
jgi:hypothetical protein